MKDLSQNISFRSFFSIGPYEEDAGFRELLRSIAQQGLLVYGVLGAVIVVIYVSAHIFLVGKTIAWSYASLTPQADILLLDKCLILIFFLTMIFLSRTSISLNWIRRLLFILVWLICLAMLMEDVGMEDVSFSTAYIALALLIAVATVPYTGWQTASLTATVIVSTILAIAFVPGFFDMEPLELKTSQIIYISVIAVILTGMSSQIYINRYRQYRAFRQTEELKEKLLINEKLKDRFFANISHEFRTPLTLMLGPLNDLLRKKEETDEKSIKTSLLRLMHRNGQSLLQLINQLLELSKIDAGSIDLNLQPVDLGALVRDSVLSFSPVAESKQVDLSCSVDNELLITRVDPHQIERAVNNLISNAVKFTPEGGKVGISVSENASAGGIQIKINDTGLGIPEGDLPYVFDRFYQVAHSAGTFSEGTGIGLALVKEIVELHGGTVQVSSEPGRGSEFVINLERYFGDATYTGSVESHTQNTAGIDVGDLDIWEADEYNSAGEDAPTVILIDDNPDILTYLQPYLSERYNTIVKERSDEALKSILENHIDLVISDVMMPEPDGFEVCKTIKEHPKLNHIPVILLTARAGEESRIEGLELGADDYISKPFSASELMIRAENLIELRRMLRNRYSQEVYLKGNKIEVSSEDARFLNNVQSIIDEHMGNSNFGVDWLADEVNLSSRQLQRKMRSVTDLSAGGYIRLMRLERASQLLVQKWGNISEISYRVGFQDAKYFSRLFKQTYGANPTEFAAKQD